MKIAMIIVRTLMGLLFIFASIVVLFNLFPPPAEFPSEMARKFNEGIMATPYFMKLLKVTELLCGIAFITGRYVPLATVVIAPIIINIFLYHTFVDLSGLPVAIFLVLANVFVAYYYRDHYKGLLAAKYAG
jgi:putative oxidoreductase